ALIILTRPTLAPAVLLLLIFKKLKLSRYLIAGFLTPLLLTLTYLIYHQLLPDFIYLFFSFNTTYYSALAGKLPSLRQIALVGLVTIPALVSLVRGKKYLSILIILTLFLPAWPRFELTHLQPAIALTLFFWVTNKSLRHSRFPLRHSRFPLRHSRAGGNLYKWIPHQVRDDKKLLLIFLIFLSIRKITTANYGNFYLNPETQEVSSFIKTQEENQLFVLGGSDLIYPLSNKTPAGDYYLPSLPWYYANPDFVLRQIDALNHNPNALVVINTPVTSFAQPVYQHILDQYTKIHTVSSYQIYKIKP
ncbi:hypothetical protein KKG65_00575, partial [Patescibacteria group bacterium]|nr:hypothetical protein [Patescibacteria group bacterium]